MPDLSGCPVKVIDIGKIVFETAFVELEALEERAYPEVENDVAIILHSSGSTAGVPKLIPWTNSWITATTGRLGVWFGGDNEVIPKMGNFNHGAAMLRTYVPFPWRVDSHCFRDTWVCPFWCYHVDSFFVSLFDG